ncbi:hypothetical protein EJB05_03788, partial [Eragrostis curvula]
MTPPPPAPSSTAAARRQHVLLFPLPYQGHITPMFRLAGVLQARGFAITVFHTHFNAPDASRHPEYRFVPVPDGLSGPAPVAVNDVVARILALNGACEAAFRDRLAGVLEEYSESGDNVACLIADVHLLSMVEVAKKLGVPTLTLRTGSAACFTAFLAYPMLCEKGYVPVQGMSLDHSQLDMPVSELPPHRVRDLLVLDGEDGHVLVQEYLAHAVAAVKASTGLILNTFDALERRELDRIRRDLDIPVFDIGPLHMFSPAAESSLLYVEHQWKVGFELGGELSRSGVEAAVRRLMTETDGDEMRARAGELKKAAVECTGKAGSSCLAIDKLVTHIMSL